MKKSCIYMMLISSLTGVLKGSDQVATNLEMFTAVMDSVLQQSLRMLPLDPGKPVLIEGLSASDPVDRFFFGRLQSALDSMQVPAAMTVGDSVSFPISQMTGGIEPVEHNVIITILDASVIYTKSGRNHLFGTRWIERLARFKVNMRVLEHNGHLVVSKTFDCNNSDRISYKQLTRVEQRGAVIGFPDQPEISDWMSRLEPFLMLASVGTVVYLFYIIRS